MSVAESPSSGMGGVKSMPVFVFILLLSSTYFFIKLRCFRKFNVNSSDPDRDRRFVGPDLGPNGSQRLSADDKSRP